MTEKLSFPERESFLAEGKEIVQRTGLQHIGFIVDGNRRWAQQRGLPPIEGHRKATEIILETVRNGVKMGIGVMSFWLLSTENWQRGQEFMGSIFNLGREIKDRVREELTNLNVRFKTIGRKDRLPEDLTNILMELERETRKNSGPAVLAAIDYGGRDEMTRAVREITTDIIDGLLFPRALTEGRISSYLDTAGFPDPDVVVRTSGEMRSSGFMIWQAAYAEWIFAPSLFPDFDLGELVAALREFSHRNRRFGR